MPNHLPDIFWYRPTDNNWSTAQWRSKIEIQARAAFHIYQFYDEWARDEIKAHLAYNGHPFFQYFLLIEVENYIGQGFRTKNNWFSEAGDWEGAQDTFFLRDINGNRVHKDRDYLIDFTAQAVIDFVVARCRRWMFGVGGSPSGFDAIFLDNLPVRTDNDWLRAIVQKQSGSRRIFNGNNVELSDSIIQATLLTFLQKIWNALKAPPVGQSSRLLWANMIDDPRSGTSWNKWLQYLDGGYCEDAFTGYNDLPERHVLSTSGHLGNLLQMEQCIALGKTFFAGIRGLIDDEINMQFGLGSYMLGIAEQGLKSPQNTAATRYTATRYPPIYEDFPAYAWAEQIGNPLGARYNVSGGIARDFTNGKITVYPGTRTSNWVIGAAPPPPVTVEQQLLGALAVSSSAATSNTPMSLQVGPPTGVASGEWVYLLSSNRTQDAAPTPPEGFLPLDSNSRPFTLFNYLWYKKAGANEQPYTVQYTKSQHTLLATFRSTGTHALQAIDKYASFSNQASGTTFALPSIDPDFDNPLLVAVVFAAWGIAAMDAPATMSEWYRYAPAGPGLTLEIYKEQYAGSAATGARSPNVSAQSATYGGFLLAFRPAYSIASIVPTSIPSGEAIGSPNLRGVQRPALLGALAVSSSAATSNTPMSLQVGPPTGVASGEWVYLLSSNRTQDAAPTAPAGFTPVDSNSRAFTLFNYLWRKQAGANEQPYTVQYTKSQHTLLATFRSSATHPLQPIDKYSSLCNQSSSTTFALPSIDPDHNDPLLVAIVFAAWGYAAMDAPATMSEWYRYAPEDVGLTFEIYREQYTGNAATGARSPNVSAQSATYGGFLFAIRPAAALTTLRPTSIPSSEAIGTARLNVGYKIAPVGIGSSFAIGIPALKMRTRVQATGIASAQAIGVPTLLTKHKIQVTTGISTQEAIGTPALQIIKTSLYPASVTSSEHLGTPALVTPMPPRMPDLILASLPLATIGDSFSLDYVGKGELEETNIGRLVGQRLRHAVAARIQGQVYPWNDHDADIVARVMSLDGVLPIFMHNGTWHAVTIDANEITGFYENQTDVYDLAVQIDHNALLADVMYRGKPGAYAFRRVEGRPYSYTRVTLEPDVGQRADGIGSWLSAYIAEGTHDGTDRSHITLVADVTIRPGAICALGLGVVPVTVQRPFGGQGIGVRFAGTQAAILDETDYPVQGITLPAIPGMYRVKATSRKGGSRVELFYGRHRILVSNSVSWSSDHPTGAVFNVQSGSAVLHRWWIVRS